MAALTMHLQVWRARDKSMIHRHFPPSQLHLRLRIHHHHPHNQRSHHYIRPILTTVFAPPVGIRFYFVRPRDTAAQL